MQGKKGKATVNPAFAPLVAEVNLVHETGVKVVDRLEAKLKVTILVTSQWITFAFFRSFALTLGDNSSGDFERRRKEQGLTLLVSSCILFSDCISLVFSSKERGTFCYKIYIFRSTLMTWNVKVVIHIIVLFQDGTDFQNGHDFISN